jgi:hypothetical protein
MLAYLDEYVLPIVRREVGNVEVCFRLVPNPAGVLERPVVEHFLCVQPVKEPLQVYALGMGAGSAMPDPPASRLVDDARDHHFPQLFRKWDSVVAGFKEYNNACLGYVEMLRAEIVRENPLLPEFNLQSYDSEWVNAIALGVIIFLRQIGLPIRELVFKVEDDHRIWSYNTLAVARGLWVKWCPCRLTLEGWWTSATGCNR